MLTRVHTLPIISPALRASAIQRRLLTHNRWRAFEGNRPRKTSECAARPRRVSSAPRCSATKGVVIRIVVIGMGLLGGMLGRRWAELGRKAKALVAQIGPRGWLASAAKASPDAVVRRGLGRKLAFALLRQHS
jgi:hypothetical protein